METTIATAIIAAIGGGVAALIPAYFALRSVRAQLDSKIELAKIQERSDAERFARELMSGTKEDIIELRKDAAGLRQRVANLQDTVSDLRAHVNGLMPWKRYAKVVMRIAKDAGLTIPEPPIDYFVDDDEATHVE